MIQLYIWMHILFDVLFHYGSLQDMSIFPVLYSRALLFILYVVVCNADPKLLVFSLFYRLSPLVTISVFYVPESVSVS